MSASSYVLGHLTRTVNWYVLSYSINFQTYESDPKECSLNTTSFSIFSHRIDTHARSVPSNKRHKWHGMTQWIITFLLFINVKQRRHDHYYRTVSLVGRPPPHTHTRTRARTHACVYIEVNVQIFDKVQIFVWTQTYDTP